MERRGNLQLKTGERTLPEWMRRALLAAPGIARLIRLRNDAKNFADPFEFGARRGVFIGKQRGFAKGDGAEILHRTRSEIRYCDQVQLVAGIGDTVVIREPLERKGADFGCPPGQRVLTRHMDDS